MVKRVSTMMGQVASENESAFLKGRLILDNILVSHKLMHYWKNKREGR